MHREYCPLLTGQSTERSLELIAERHADLSVIGGRDDLQVGDHPQTGLPAARVPELGEARIDQQAIEPRLQAIVIAQAA